MIRAIIAVVVGLLGWGVVATALDILLRMTLPGYAAAEPQLRFTLGMMAARLALPGALPSVAAGFLSGWISPGNRWVTPAVAVILLGMFLPSHYRLWAQFPLWYHLTFLGSLILLTGLGGRLGRLFAISRVRAARRGAAAADRPSTMTAR